MGALLKAAALEHLNRREDVDRNLELLIQFIPDAATQVNNTIASFVLSKDLNKEIVDGLRKAGLNKGYQNSRVKLQVNKYNSNTQNFLC